MQIDENWSGCTLQDFISLSREECLALYFCMQETDFSINQRHLNLSAPAFNLLKSKILARAEILLED